MKQWLKSNLFFLIVSCAVFVSLFFVISCKTFSPEDYVQDGQPAECNDCYVIMGFYSTVEKSDSAFIGTVYNECKIAREQKRKIVREAHCKKMIFGDGPLDKEQYKLYAQYLECVKSQ